LVKITRRAFLASLLAAPAASLAAQAQAPPGSLAPAVAKIARRYRVSRHAVEQVATLAQEHFPADPLTLLALVGVESSWRPWAVGAAAEVGLCQVRPEMHGVSAAELADPETNVKTAGRILRAHVDRLGLRAGIARFNGAGPAARAYADKVLVERRRLAA
jgi:soluble lytic murein transglycosylase-like protein